MASTRDIRMHMRSVEQTRKITNAMHLVSTSRMRKAMQGIERNREYFLRAVESMRNIRARTQLRHPYLEHRTGPDSDKTLYIVIAGERGLSGSYNHDVLCVADAGIAAHSATHIFTVGSYAAAHFRRQGKEVNENFLHIAEDPTINTARRMARNIMALYDAGEIDELRLVYTRFINTLHYEPVDIELLPIELDAFGAKAAVHPAEEDLMLYDPSPAEVFSALVPQFIIGYLYGALVHSYASENCARMASMDGATRNADEMLGKLERQYHSLRQLSITNELSEIVGTAAAFEQQAY